MSKKKATVISWIIGAVFLVGVALFVWYIATATPQGGGEVPSADTVSSALPVESAAPAESEEQVSSAVQPEDEEPTAEDEGADGRPSGEDMALIQELYDALVDEDVDFLYGKLDLDDATFVRKEDLANYLKRINAIGHRELHDPTYCCKESDLQSEYGEMRFTYATENPYDPIERFNLTTRDKDYKFRGSDFMGATGWEAKTNILVYKEITNLRIDGVPVSEEYLNEDYEMREKWQDELKVYSVPLPRGAADAQELPESQYWKLEADSPYGSLVGVIGDEDTLINLSDYIEQFDLDCRPATFTVEATGEPYAEARSQKE